MTDLHLLARIYDTYSNAKEKFIDRNFQTNRYYLALCLVLLVLLVLFISPKPELLYVIVISTFGIIVSVLWWINLDTYQFQIKVKYQHVLEKIEEQFPVKPYKDEFIAAQEIQKKKKVIVFADLQKYFALLLVFIFCWGFCWSFAKKIYDVSVFNNAPVGSESMEFVE